MKEVLNLMRTSEMMSTNKRVMKIGLSVCMNKLDLESIINTNPFTIDSRVIAIKKVKKVPTAPT